MPKKVTRRQAMKIVSGVALLPFTSCDTHGELGNQVIFGHGVASGDPDQSSVVIWTRVSGLTTPVKVDWFWLPMRPLNMLSAAESSTQTFIEIIPLK